MEPEPGCLSAESALALGSFFIEFVPRLTSTSKGQSPFSHRQDQFYLRYYCRGLYLMILTVRASRPIKMTFRALRLRRHNSHSQFFAHIPVNFICSIMLIIFTHVNFSRI